MPRRTVAVKTSVALGVVAAGTPLTGDVIAGEEDLGVALTAVVTIETRVAVTDTLQACSMIGAHVDAVIGL